MCKDNKNHIPEDQEDIEGIWLYIHLYSDSEVGIQQKINKYFIEYPYERYDTMVVLSPRLHKLGFYYCKVQRSHN